MAKSPKRPARGRAAKPLKKTPRRPPDAPADWRPEPPPFSPTWAPRAIADLKIPPGHRASPLVRAARLDLIEHMLTRQLLDHGTVERELARAWQVTQRAIRIYIAEVYRRAQPPPGSPLPEDAITRDRMRKALVERYNEAVQRGDTRNALKALDMLGKLYGLYINRHEFSGPGGAPLGVTAEDAAQALETALDKVARATNKEPPSDG